MAKHADVPKQPVFRYEGPPIGPGALSLMSAWAAVPPGAFLPPPQRRMMTASELRVQAAAAEAASREWGAA